MTSGPGFTSDKANVMPSQLWNSPFKWIGKLEVIPFKYSHTAYTLNRNMFHLKCRQNEIVGNMRGCHKAEPLLVEL